MAILCGAPPSQTLQDQLPHGTNPIINIVDDAIRVTNKQKMRKKALGKMAILHGAPPNTMQELEDNGATVKRKLVKDTKTRKKVLIIAVRGTNELQGLHQSTQVPM